MATPVHSKSTAVLVDEYDLTSLFTKIAPSNSRDVYDKTVLGESSKSFHLGFKQGEINAEGLFTIFTETPTLDSLFGEPGTPRIVSAFPEGHAVGKPAYILYANQSEFSLDTSVGDLIRNAAKFSSLDDGLERGLSLHPLSAEVGTANGATVDGLAASTGGALGVLHVTAIAGAAPSVVIKLQSSTDAAAWGDVTGGAFTAATIATKQRLEIASGVTINRYLRCVATFGGTTTSITFQCSLARR
ncbi:MAG TPA: hypothetical protein VFX97_16875 [Pyrinomonadaceae bacterium]|nr:hypothetical protein [Pyrinomonadaceae bacterium]